MIPNMYKMAGELLPGVIHVSARTVAGHALSIFGDHSDIYSCRQTGYAMLCSNNPQEVMDLGAVAHLCAIKGRRAGSFTFSTASAPPTKSRKLKPGTMPTFPKCSTGTLWTLSAAAALNPEHPVLHGSAENDDVFFQVKESANRLL